MYRVIQWGLGNVGRHSLRAILERPELELVGVRAYSADKVGRDAGELLGQEPIGVTATADTAAILETDADVVIHNPYGTTLVQLDETVDDLVRLLASGKDVISSSVELLQYVKPGLAPNVVTPEMVERLEQACAAGRATLYGTGMTPGFALDLWPITMSRVCRTVDRIRIVEIVNMRDYRSTMMGFMGFGLTPDVEPEICRLFADAPSSPYAGALAMIADAVGQDLGGIRHERAVHTTPERLDAACGVFEVGTVVATKSRFIGDVDGEPFVEIELVWNVDDTIVPTGWPTGHCKWLLEIDGEPSIRTEMELRTEVDSKRPTSITVAMSCLNAIPAVCAAPAGLANHLTLPVFGTRGGVKA